MMEFMRKVGRPVAGKARKVGRPVARKTRKVGRPVAGKTRKAGRPVAGKTRKVGLIVKKTDPALFVSRQSATSSKSALPPAAAVLMVTVCSVKKRSR